MKPNYLITQLYNLGFLLFLALFSLGQLQRVQLTPRVGIYLHDFLLVGWMLSTLITKSHEWRTHLINRLHKTPKSTWALVASVILSLVIATVRLPSLNPWLYTFRLLLYGTFSYSLLFTVSFTQLQQRLVWCLAGFGIAWLGLLQYLLIPNTRFLWILGWDDHYYRLISTQLDPNYTGILLVMTMYWLWTLSFLNRNLKIVLSGGVVLAILLTFSRATYLSLALSALFILLHRKITRRTIAIFTGSVIGAVLLIWLLPKPGGEGVNLFRTYSIEQRFISSQRALSSLTPIEWVVGKGPFQPTNFNPNPVLNQHAPFSDNLLAFLLTCLGIPGFGLAIYQFYKITNYIGARNQLLLAAWIAVLIHSQFNHTLFQPFVFLMVGGGLASLESKRHR